MFVSYLKLVNLLRLGNNVIECNRMTCANMC